MTTTHRLLVLGLMSALIGCSDRQNSVQPYVVNTTCAGGGGIRNCTATNPTPTRLGPFDLEFEFVDDRGMPIGRTMVTNTEGLEPQGQWEFTLTGPAHSRGVRLVSVTPR